jgi:hypothetical protein
MDRNEPQTRVRPVTDEWLEVLQANDGVPVQVRPGTDDCQVQFLIHHGSGGSMVEFRIEDLTHAIDLVRVMDR